MSNTMTIGEVVAAALTGDEVHDADGSL